MQMDHFKDIEQTRLIAGGKSDGVETTKAMGKIIKEKCKGTRAFVVKKALHGWDLQYPELFAQGVRTWVEGEDVFPHEFEELF